MNKIIQSLVKQVVQIEVSGKKIITGTLIDLGSDMIVLFTGKEFVYIPLNHVQSFKVDSDIEDEIEDPTEFPSFTTEDDKGNLSFGEVLTQAKDKFVEIYVTGGQSLHGCITSVMNNYFVFQSPIYKTMYITIEHLKWLIPYTKNEKPYGMDNHCVLLQKADKLLASNFAAHVESLKSELVVFNMGGDKSHIGKINNVDANIVEIQTARATSNYLNLDHIKTVHQV
ncbi:DUF2642 domain-containing protein [Sporosarcina sp. G11-34]|uniref:DUF2642 domain-containing protein n=1 Tax=Sporosarcina sp. G11-34 TaxID=2849605 RepID=UPI0022A8EA5C|nr:DUF2642 domain-containing protein [Sporosarcina sp. G11-34]MCZ2259997.1 DUF2642 domain-containing protein [Sporosarcina sp. G11-34]